MILNTNDNNMLYFIKLVGLFVLQSAEQTIFF